MATNWSGLPHHSSQAPLNVLDELILTCTSMVLKAWLALLNSKASVIPHSARVVFQIIPVLRPWTSLSNERKSQAPGIKCGRNGENGDIPRFLGNGDRPQMTHRS